MNSVDVLNVGNAARLGGEFLGPSGGATRQVEEVGPPLNLRGCCDGDGRPRHHNLVC